MKKGQHIKAKDPDYKASLQGGNGGGTTSSTAITKPKQGNVKYGKAKAIAKLLGTAAAVGGAGYLGLKAMKHLRNSWQNNPSYKPSQKSKNQQQPIHKEGKPNLNPNFYNELKKNWNNPDYELDI